MTGDQRNDIDADLALVQQKIERAETAVGRNDQKNALGELELALLNLKSARDQLKETDDAH